MSGDGRAKRGTQHGWRYLGASGLLQPLSEEFMYRAARDALRNACRRPHQQAGGKRDAD